MWVKGHCSGDAMLVLEQCEGVSNLPSALVWTDTDAAAIAEILRFIVLEHTLLLHIGARGVDDVLFSVCKLFAKRVFL